MKDYNLVAIVKLFGDPYDKDYGFALYCEDHVLFTEPMGKQMVIVNPRNKLNFEIGFVKEVMTVDEYITSGKNKGKKPTAEVIGVVNKHAYNVRVDEKMRIEKIEARKKIVEHLLNDEITKRKNIEFYKEMAEKYSDDPSLMKLVTELEGLEKELENEQK